MGKLYAITYDKDTTSEEDIKSLCEALPDVVKDSDFVVMPNFIQLAKLSTDDILRLKDYLEDVLYSRYTLAEVSE